MMDYSTIFSFLIANVEHNIIYMISAEIDKFYKQVIKDFVQNIGKQEIIVRQLQQQNIFLNQIQEGMHQKLKDPNNLFKRLTFGYNEIEKEMLSRFATVEEIIYHERKNRLNSHSRSIKLSSVPSQSLNDDLENYEDNDSDQELKVNYIPQEEKEDGHEPQQSAGHSVSSDKRRPASEFSLDDLSQFDAEYGDAVKRMRENAKIHILGTYDCQSKRHYFKHDTTQISLDNVFIKVEGVAKEIVLKRLQCVSRKRIHH